MANRLGPNPEAVDAATRCLSATSAEVWARWSVDRERREIQKRVNAEREAREAANMPIYPRECAERIAEETCDVAPDWRHIRPTLGPAWGRLLRAQPELTPDLTRQREAAITAVFASVPSHMRECVRDLRILIDLMLAAHEAASYQVGWASHAAKERKITQREHALRPRDRRPHDDDPGGLRLMLEPD